MSFRSKPAAFTTFLDIGQGGLRLGTNSARHQLALVVNAFLPGHVECVPGDHSVTEGKTRGAGELDHAALFAETRQGCGQDKQHETEMIQ